MDWQKIKMEKVHESMPKRKTSEWLMHWPFETNGIAMMMKRKENESFPRRTTRKQGLGDLEENS